MKNLLIVLTFLVVTACQPEKKTGITIHLNSIGFLPSAKKTASIVGEVKSFVLKREDDHAVVFKGETTVPVLQQDVDQHVCLADFSSFTEEGKYYLETQDGSRSVSVEISPTVYHDAFYTSMRAFYLWRCGTAVEGEHNGQIFSHGPCHLHDGYDDFTGNPGQWRDGTGGWHDAGDYGKYTVNAGITLGMLFLAWDQFQPQLEQFPLNLPETAPGFPDYLKELKWETDWLFSMQYPDGSGRVSHKLTRLNFAPFIAADADTARRYFTEWSSAATASFTGMMAQAARYFQPYDADYAQKCLDAALLSYDFLQKNPEYKRFEQGDFKTGGYQSPDEDDRLWAAAELWETTDESKYLTDFEERAAAMDCQVDEDWDWADVSNLAMFTYALSEKEGKTPEVSEKITQNIVTVANEITEKGRQDVYGRPLGGRYYWGCNGTVARQAINLQVANRLSPNPAYRQTALDAISHLLGRNYYNRSFVTGLGISPAMHPHDRRSGADELTDPWPGYLVGGGHSATGWNDLEEDYATNEIAINWQGALVYALAGFLADE
ncbi:glycoside hydrolase family 9 protein [Gaoshiqia sediminis]|uniref:Glycoside hydrolase family 9 protein n=1 Tax=Gaoshiqia sediminis TaxID=2986998 RepID=A0AA41Y794_9BACT|nr:glycoside hydrolase family 9 protein [Gaoshiqia sediminis]MCW0482771.1 glycoside hydrolase family 9 protein [Gaoshiqia sediminis]